MKNLLLSLAISFAVTFCYAQNSSPNIPVAGIASSDNFTYNGYTVSHYGLGWYQDPSSAPASAFLSAYGGIKIFTAGTPRGVWDAGGKLGIGTISPQSILHVNSSAISINASNRYNGNLIIEGSASGRSITSGASLEFVIPAGNGADANDPNSWGQGRIITVAGNTNVGDPTGKMIFGTRRHFDKNTGSGIAWNYGDDLVIDGAGHIGIGTLTPREALSVNGNIRSKQVKVEIANWPDYVFKPKYNLLSLAEVKTYIDQNQHLPEMPSEQEIAKDGLNLGEIVKLQTKKIEELTLYLIEKDKEMKSQQDQLNKLCVQLEKLTSTETKK